MTPITPSPAASLADIPLGTLLSMLADKTPAPGGGAVAPIAGSLAAGLASMVVAYSINKKDLAQHQPMLADAQQRLSRARAMLLELADEDARAYALVNALQKLPEGDPRRAAEFPAAAKACAGVPVFVLVTCLELMQTIARLDGTTNKHLRSDLRIAAILCDAAVRGAACNVAVNESIITEPAMIAANRSQCADAVTRSAAMLNAIKP